MYSLLLRVILCLLDLSLLVLTKGHDKRCKQAVYQAVLYCLSNNRTFVLITYSLKIAIEVQTSVNNMLHTYTVSQKTRHQTLAHNFPKC